MNCPNVKTISGKALEEKIIEELNLIVQQYCQTDEIRLTDFHAEQITALENQLKKLKTQVLYSKGTLRHTGIYDIVHEVDRAFVGGV